MSFTAGWEPRSDALTEAGKTLGSPNYMAPEQLEHPGEVDHRADIYSLGVVFYEMLTGELPLGRFAPPSQKSAADPRVDEVVLRALEKERERRQHSAGEVKTQVETITSTPGKCNRSGCRHGNATNMEIPDHRLALFRRADVWCHVHISQGVGARQSFGVGLSRLPRRIGLCAAARNAALLWLFRLLWFASG